MKAIVFDLDGTLIHSTADLQAAVNAMLAEESADALDEATVQSFVGNGLAKLVERVMEATGLDAARHVALTERTLQHYNRENGRRTTVYPGAAGCLRHLADHGHALGICTNKPAAPARHILEKLGLARYFQAIVGGDSLNVRKPDPQPLLHTLTLLEAGPADALYVGDSEVDAETATRADIPFALYTEGYRKTPVASFETVLQFADFADLQAFILDPAQVG